MSEQGAIGAIGAGCVGWLIFFAIGWIGLRTQHQSIGQGMCITQDRRHRPARTHLEADHQNRLKR